MITLGGPYYVRVVLDFIFYILTYSLTVNVYTLNGRGITVYSLYVYASIYICIAFMADGPSGSSHTHLFVMHFGFCNLLRSQHYFSKHGHELACMQVCIRGGLLSMLTEVSTHYYCHCCFVYAYDFVYHICYVYIGDVCVRGDKVYNIGDSFPAGDGCNTW